MGVSARAFCFTQCEKIRIKSNWASLMVCCCRHWKFHPRLAFWREREMMVTSDISIFNNTLRVFSKHSQSSPTHTCSRHLGGFVCQLCVFFLRTQLGLVVRVLSAPRKKIAEHGGGQMPTPAKRIKAQFELPFWRSHTPYSFLLRKTKRPGAMRPCVHFSALSEVKNGVSVSSR